MAVFRVQKTQNYTIMSNHHLRNKALSLKAKGLLSLMLSLPEDWDYTTRGLASICKEGVDGIRATVRELENAGYIIRRRVRDQSGQVRGMEYTVFEQPQEPEPENPVQAKPEREKPVQAKPAQEKPAQENPAQLNTKETNNENSKYESDLIRTQYRNLILDNIEYALLAARNPTDRARLDELCTPDAGHRLCKAKNDSHCAKRLPDRGGEIAVFEAERRTYPVCFGQDAAEHHRDPKHQAVLTGGAVQCAADDGKLLRRADQP